MSNFVHLHVHTEFSMLDGLGSVDQYAERAVELGQPALAITDHGTMCGVPRFYHATRKAGVEPIIGCEFYFVEDADDRPAKGEKLPERCHVVLLARGQRGYEVLSELSTETHRNFYYKPLLDMDMVEMLGADANHLVCLSGCAASPVSRAILEGEDEYARQMLVWWRENFPHFYIELQHHDTEWDRGLNTKLLDLSRRYNVPHIVTNDPHYVLENEAHYHDQLLAVQTASDVDDPERFRFDGTGHYLRSDREMRSAFAEYANGVWSEGARNTERVAKMCRVRIPQWEKRTWHIPDFTDVPDPQLELRRLTLLGLKEWGVERDPAYRQRALHELKVIKEAGVAGVLLITKDAIDYAVDKGIRVGPGRGSVCGTLVGFLIGLHKIDPVHYELKFERFLNPARPRMPDIDTDVDPERRDEVFEYISNKYGDENVVHVAAYQNMMAKAAFRSFAKAYGVTFAETNRLAKEVPEDLEGHVEWPASFNKLFESHPDLKDVVERLAGTKRAVSAHPAGVVIANPEDHVRKLVPEMWLASGKRMCGQYDLDSCEEMGLMKWDFLGLRTLKTIDEAVRLIEESTGEKVDPDSWVPDHERNDAKVWRLLEKGKTGGVFQMEGPVNTTGIRKIKPTCFEDVVSCTSLYRTGAISAGFPDKFLENRRHKKKDIAYAVRELKPILERTWGVVLYQEQVMEMGEHIAGFSMEAVDDIKEAIKHKKSKLMKSMRPAFVRGAMRTVGCTQAAGEEMWKMIAGYSGYGYNRSHAVAYTFLTYQTARLKALWPRQYTAALLRTVLPDSAENKDKRNGYLSEASADGMKIHPPDINGSDVLTIPTADGVRFGFQDIAGIGAKAAEKIVQGRPEDGYATVDQVAAAVRNKGAMEALEGAGALLSLGHEAGFTREKQAELLNWQFHDRLKKLRPMWTDFKPPEAREPGDTWDVVLYGEIVYARTDGVTKDKKKPYATFRVRYDSGHVYDIRMWSETQKHWKKIPKGTVVRVEGRWEHKWLNLVVQDFRDQVTIIDMEEQRTNGSTRRTVRSGNQEGGTSTNGRGRHVRRSQARRRGDAARR